MVFRGLNTLFLNGLFFFEIFNDNLINDGCVYLYTIMMAKVERLVQGFSKHILSELDRENHELEMKSARKEFDDLFRERTTF